MRNKLRKILPYLTALFIILVGYLLYNNLSSIKWDDVGRALRNTSPVMAMISVSIAGLIYVLLASYDYLSIRYLKLKNISYLEILRRAFVCYAFNLNLGSLVGGLALRYRVYSRWKIDLDRIPYIIAVSTFSNWLGYGFLLSLILLLEASQLEKLVPFPTVWHKGAALIVMILVAWYFWGCSKGKSFHFRGEKWKMPGIPFALVQIMLSTFQWTLQSFIIYLLLHSMNVEISYYPILFTFLLSSVIAVFTHIPAGLGVLEVIFLRMELGIPQSDLLVALIIYRVAYYLVPLFLAIFMYGGLEIKRKRTN